MLTALLLVSAPLTQQVPQLAPLASGPRRQAATPGARQLPPQAPRDDRPQVSSGAYNQSSFNYTDPFAPDFHPLGGEEFTATKLEESVILNSGLITLSGLRTDDELAGAGSSGTMARLNGSGLREHAASGSLRGDGTLQIVCWEQSRLRVYEADANGAYQVVASESLPSLAGIHFDCADVDGDGRDEIVCAVFKSSSSRRHEVWVIDDLLDGPWGTSATMPLLDSRVLGTGGSAPLLRVAAAELDGDPRAEAFLVYLVTSTSARAYAIDDVQAGLVTVAEDSFFVTSSQDGVDICAADTRGDGSDELVVRRDDRVVVKEVDGIGFADDGLFFGRDRTLGLAAYDLDGNGTDEIAFVDIEFVLNSGFPPALGDQADLRVMRRSGPSSWTVQAMTPVFGTSFSLQESGLVTGVGLVTVEDDSDGREELRGYLSAELALGGEPLYELRVNGTSLDHRRLRSTLNTFRDWFIVAGEDDRETSVLRYTGEKELHLAAPLPIVVMEAVPTKEGIAQNYGSTVSTFSSSNSTSTAYATSAAISIGITGGLTSPDLFGLFEAEATTTITGAVTNSTGSAETVRRFTTYGAGHDAHSIVFQGTLFHAYLYEVVRAADPSAVGATVALNVPVASNEWKWTLDAYNAAFPGRRIDPRVIFAHAGGRSEIGDPTTYPSIAEINGLVTGGSALYDGWVGGSVTVGEGIAFNGFGLALGTVATTVEERTLSVDVGTSFAAGGTVFGASFGVSSSDVFTVETSSETEYAAQVGDIAPADYGAWNYEVGMVVLQDDVNGEYPFQVIRYGVETLGWAYP